MTSQLSPFEVGQILALHNEEYSHRQIAERVCHGRGDRAVSLASVGAVFSEGVRFHNIDVCCTANEPGVVCGKP